MQNESSTYWAAMRGAKNKSKKFHNQSEKNASTRHVQRGNRKPKRCERRTRSTTQCDTLGPHAQREALPEIHPRRRAPKHREPKDVEDRKGDDDVPAALVSLGKVCGGRTGEREGEVADEPNDDGTDGFPDGTC